MNYSGNLRLLTAEELKRTTPITRINIITTPSKHKTLLETSQRTIGLPTTRLNLGEQQTTTTQQIITIIIGIHQNQHIQITRNKPIKLQTLPQLKQMLTIKQTNKLTLVWDKFLPLFNLLPSTLI